MPIAARALARLLHGRLLGAALVLAAAAGCAAHAPMGPPETNAPRVLASDLEVITGATWHGTLTYLDYKLNKPVTIRSSMAFKRLPSIANAAEQRWEIRLGYDDEPQANRGDTVVLAEGGLVLDRENVVERTLLPDGEVRVVTEADGEDDHKPARFRHVYTLGQNACSLQKLVRFGGGAFFERNLYRWTR